MNENKPNDISGSQTSEGIPRQNLLALSVISAIVYVFLSAVIFHFVQGKTFFEVFSHGLAVGPQLLVGVVGGAVGAGTIAFVMKRSPVADVLDDFYIVRLISQTRLTAFDRTQLSLFAGAGEELLFRGAIQPSLGIWWTSLIFVGLHGYFKFRSPGHIIFGGMMFGLSVGLGYLFEYAGLIAAMSGHAVYDIIMLSLVARKK